MHKKEVVWKYCFVIKNVIVQLYIPKVPGYTKGMNCYKNTQSHMIEG